MPLPRLPDGFAHRLRAATPWPPTGAVLATMAILMLAIGFAGGAQSFAFWAWTVLSRKADTSSYISEANGMIVLGLMQAAIVVLTWWVAGWFGGERRELLSLTRPVTKPLFLAGLAIMAAILIPYNLAIYALWPADFTKDMQPFSELARSRAAWLAGLVVTIGAPVSEELLFRGFLLPALALAGSYTFVGIAMALLVLQVSLTVLAPLLLGVELPAMPVILGMNVLLLIVAAFAVAGERLFAREREVAAVIPAPGQPVSPQSFALAACFSTAGWTVMHGYSMTGVLEVFIIGMLFCWLVWRTGSLWLTMALHAFYNGAQFLVLMVVPLPAPMVPS